MTCAPSALDGAGGHAAVDLILTEQEYDQCGDDGDEHAGTDVVVLAAHGAGEHVQRGGDHLVLGLILQVQVGHVILVVGAHALEDGRGDHSGLEQRQQDLEKDAEVGAAVQDGAFVQGGTGSRRTAGRCRW